MRNAGFQRAELEDSFLTKSSGYVKIPSSIPVI